MEFLTRFLSFSEGSALVFTQAGFWIFFVLVIFIFSFLYKKISWRNTFLFLASLFFYYKAGGLFVVIFFVLILINFFLAKFSVTRDNKRARKMILFFSLLLNLGLLIFFKYTSFFISLIDFIPGIDLVRPEQGAFELSFTNMVVPIGISFFTFQLIRYSVEVYRRKIEPLVNLVDFGLYISFFPNLISGPLVKPEEFIPQMRKPFLLSKEEFGAAVFMILTGLVKKMVVADYLSVNFVSRVFENPHLFTGFENLLAIYGYTLQIYFDFSGYTDMAIGTALLLGFRLPPNFNAPYCARNINEFWRRWHISLTTWFRDYLFLPLAYWLSGKMKREHFLHVKSENWIYLVGILVTFLLCGLWHGAAINFVIWGGIHGIALIVHKMIYPKVRIEKNSRKLKNFLSAFVTFQFVAFTWILFRTSSIDSLSAMIQRIFSHFHTELIPDIILSYWKIILVMILGYGMIWFPTALKIKLRNSFIFSSELVKVLIGLIIIIFAYQFKIAGIQPFIYFQF